jgi:putative ABC transport system ATP-binding protein
MIEVRGITKTYGKKRNTFTALDNISLMIPKGASVAIVGKSGSGKSTLMHAMSGLDRPQTGEVVIGSKDILQMSQKAIDKFRSEQMGFIFQSFFVEANESCYDNVGLVCEIADQPAGAHKGRIERALAAVELTDKIKSRARDLSGGQKQRLAIARAIVNEPKILFADEPTGNLDSVTGQRIEDLLFAYNKTKGVTLIIVTHDHDLARRCDMQINIRDGKISSIDTAEKKPASKPHPTRKKVQ